MTSISAERSGLAGIGGGLIRREQWGARHNYGGARTVTEPARQIFIHITVTNPGAYRSHAAHIRAIEAIGRSRFPNTGGSYNRVIVAGVTRAYELQPIGRRGAHTVNDHRRSRCNRWGSACPGHGGDLTAPSWNLNYTARSYAYGANTHHSVPDSVLDTFAKTIADDIKAGFVRRDARIHGHRCVSSKSCPGDKMWARMHELERRINNHLEDDDMPSAKEVADAVYDRFTHEVGKSEAAVRLGMFSPGDTVHPNKALEYAWGYAQLAHHALRGPVVAWEDGQHHSVVHTLSWLQRSSHALMSAQEGLDTPAILARIDQRAAEDAARDEAVLEAIGQIESGNTDAALTRLHELLGTALPDDEN